MGERALTVCTVDNSGINVCCLSEAVFLLLSVKLCLYFLTSQIFCLRVLFVFYFLVNHYQRESAHVLYIEMRDIWVLPISDLTLFSNSF